jgi:hypothetical protein
MIPGEFCDLAWAIQGRNIVTACFSRDQLLRRGAVGGGALVLSGAGLGAFAGAASAATLPDGDLAYLRLLVAAELLAADFQGQALRSGKLGRSHAALVRRMAADEKAHYGGLAELLNDAGQVPATAADIDFSYPKGSFESARAIMKLASRIEALTLGAYLGAVENVQTPAIRLPIGQIVANEAQHVGALAAAVGRPVIGRAFAPALQIDAASAALSAFES